jgi:diguanylate cyclase (GGDEF)-like protein
MLIESTRRRGNNGEVAATAPGEKHEGGADATLASSRAPDVLLAVAEPALAAELAANLARFGYGCVHPDCAADRALDESAEHLPIAIIYDAADSGSAGVATLASLQQRYARPVPVIAILREYDLQLHLQAIAAGAVAVVQWPVDFTKVMDRLEALRTPTSQPPYRILIVDDSDSMANFYGLVLKQAGMQTELVTDPLQALHAVNQFAPDLILMDVYMPRCSGPELARAIRQLDSYLSIPIVFLSSEEDLEKQLSSLTLGADDFLTKTISAKHLVTAVSVRVERARRLRQQMVSDSLTGLLNHSVLKQRLEAELARARRHGEPVSFVMIDIDHFKRINDTYGHPVGDVVIKNIARLLRQRLRSADVVGRYGGEEFALVLPGTPAAMAQQVVDELRRAFASFPFSANQGPFSATFSAGISDFPMQQDGKSLCDAADRALYLAKQRGRNRVELYSPAV